MDHNSGLFGRTFQSGANAQAQAAPAKRPRPPSRARSPSRFRCRPQSRPRRCCPRHFDGWTATEPPKTVTDPAQADSANAAALKEYDFAGAAMATYKRDGETLSVRALRFHDASGAYGAYSFYRQNGWPKEEIGTGRYLADHNRVLFWKGDTVVDATFLAHRPHVRRGTARAGQPVARSAWKPGHRAAHPRQSAPGLAGQADHALCAGPGGLCRAAAACCRRIWSASIAAPRPSPPTTRCAPDRPRSPSSTTPRRRWPPQETKDSRLHQGRQPGPAALAQAAPGLRPGIARGAPQRPAGGARQRRRHSRREPQAAGDGALRGEISSRFRSPRSPRSQRPASC